MRKLGLYILIIIQVSIIVSLIKGIANTLVSQKRVEELREKKELLEETKKREEDKLEMVRQDYYAEKVAREQLNMVKPGEVVVLVPEVEQRQDLDQDISLIDEPSWRRWLRKLLDK